MKTKNIYSALTLIVFAILFWSCAQQKVVTKNSPTEISEPKCINFDEVDEFTKKRGVASGPYQIYVEKIDLTRSTLSEFNYQENSDRKSTQLVFSVFARWEDGEKIIGLIKDVWQVQGYLQFAESRDPKIRFLLSNDDALTVPLSVVEEPTLNDEGWEFQREIFTVNDSVWSKLRDFPPKKFRIEYLGSNSRSIYEKDFVIDEKYQGQIPFALKCIDNLHLSKK